MHGDMRATHEAMHGPSTPPGSAAPTNTGSEASAATTGAPAVAAAPVGTELAAPATARANVTGTVTTTPARSAGAAVVYLEDAPVVANRGTSAAIDNKGMSFIPFVTVVAAGGRVLFNNSDPFPHNVFSPDNERFNLGMIAQKGASAHVFKTPGVYSLLCNLHPNMLGYIVVTPSSYFAKANGKGQFTVKDVPAGTYKITAWAPRQQLVTQSITVKDADVTADFALHR
jgi:plastocyanin